MRPTEVAALIQRLSGIAPATLGERALAAALRRRQAAAGLTDAARYGARLLESADEQQALLEELVVPETWFFRQPEAFALLARAARARLATAAPDTRLRLLSLPCASGEEPYSMAMALLDAGLAPRQFEIDALDISARALAQARQAVYGPNAFRGGAAARARDIHFAAEDNRFRLSETVRAQVRLAQGNLLALPGHFDGGYDVVFCRNLLIYFDAGDQQRAIEVLRRVLRPGGLLFVGAAEKSLFTGHGFELLPAPLSFALVKSETDARAWPPPVRATPRRRRPGVPARLPPLPPAPPAPPAPIVEPAVAPTQADPLARIAQLADQGELAQAMACCEALLDAGAPSAALLHWMGLIEDAQGRGAQAEQYYRKALYLDPRHADSLAHLAALLEHSGRRAAARPLRQRLSRERVE